MIREKRDRKNQRILMMVLSMGIFSSSSMEGGVGTGWLSRLSINGGKSGGSTTELLIAGGVVLFLLLSDIV